VVPLYLFQWIARRLSNRVIRPAQKSVASVPSLPSKPGVDASRDDAPQTQAIAPLWSYLGLGAVFIAAGTSLWISRDLVHEPCNIRPLLAEVARLAEPGDLVILDWASDVNQRIDPAPIKGKVHGGGWTNSNTVVDDYGSLMLANHTGNSWVVSSLDNHERTPVWKVLGDALSPQGNWSQVWINKDRQVPAAIYKFEPK
jgi:hypothetical protein